MEERRHEIRRQSDQELIEHAAREAARSHGKECERKRRHAIRHNCKASLEIELSSSAGESGDWNVSRQRIEARVLDLSEEGASIFTKHALAIGQTFGIKILLNNGATVEAVAETRWSKHKERKNGYLSGVKFTHLAPEYHQRITAFLADLEGTLGL